MYSSTHNALAPSHAMTSRTATSEIATLKSSFNLENLFGCSNTRLIFLWASTTPYFWTATPSLYLGQVDFWAPPVEAYSLIYMCLLKWPHLFGGSSYICPQLGWGLWLLTPFLYAFFLPVTSFYWLPCSDLSWIHFSAAFPNTWHVLQFFISPVYQTTMVGSAVPLPGLVLCSSNTSLCWGL